MPRQSLNTNNNKKNSKETSKIAVPIRTYRRIAATFIVLTVFLLAFIIYLSFSKASIIIETSDEPVFTDFSINIEQEPSSREAVGGKVISIMVQGELQEETTGAKEEGVGIARGVVAILNKTSRDQVLIRTTRLLTADQKLFRLDEKVTVPAGGEVEARIYADGAGEDYVIDPTNFTIPGLWEGLQDKIYAESNEKTIIDTDKIKIVSQEDLDRISNKLQNELLEKGKRELELTILENGFGNEFVSEIVEERFDAKIGEQAETVGAEMELRVVGVLYDQESLKNFARLKLEEKISNNLELVKINYEKMELEIVRYDLNAENANIRVSISGDAVLKSTSQIFDKNNLIGMDKETAINYFKNFDAVKSVVIDLKPFWLNRIPELRDHIEIKIKK